jgi:hypothetical protein
LTFHQASRAVKIFFGEGKQQSWKGSMEDHHNIFVSSLASNKTMNHGWYISIMGVHPS